VNFGAVFAQIAAAQTIKTKRPHGRLTLAKILRCAAPAEGIVLFGIAQTTLNSLQTNDPIDRTHHIFLTTVNTQICAYPVKGYGGNMSKTCI